MPLYEDRGESNAQPMTDRRELCKRIGLLGSAVLLAGISSLARAMTNAERPPSKLEEQGYHVVSWGALVSRFRF